MYYDLRVNGEVRERLGLSELRQVLTNVLEGGAGYVEVGPSGALPSVEKGSAPKKKASVKKGS